MSNNKSKGSEWHKWDLHVHTNASYDWDGSCKDRAEEIVQKAVDEELSVIAITDHHTVGELENILKEAKAKNITALPGVELRTDKGNKGIHIIGIFDSEVKPKTIYDKLLCKINMSEDDVKSKGHEQIYCNFEEACEKIHDLGGLVFIHAGQKANGIEQLDSDLRSALKIGLADLVDIFEVTSAQQVENYRKIVFPKIKRTFPCLITSDATDRSKLKHKGGHSTEVLGRHFSWIKAEPTFEGLKQILFEPAQRVALQETNPKDDYAKYVLDEVSIESSKTRFKAPQIIPLNRDLISLIGGKGSGKSLMLKNISALMSGYTPHPAIENKTTLASYRLLDKNMDGVKISSLDISEETEQDEPILYVEQEELAQKSKSKKKVREAYLRELGILDSSLDFKDLDLTIKRLIDGINEQVESILELEDQTEFLKIKGKDTSFTTYLDAKVTNLKKTIEKTSSNQTKQLISDISVIIRHGRTYRLWLKESGYPEIENELIKLNDKIESYNSRSEELGIKARIKAVNKDDITKEHEAVEAEVNKKLSDSIAEYSKIKAQLEALDIKEDIPVLLKTLEGIQNELHQFETAQKEYQAYKDVIKSRKESLSQMFGRGDVVHDAINNNIAEIDVKYHDFCADKKESPIFQKLFGEIKIKADVFFDFDNLIKEMTECFYKNTAQDLEKEIFGTKEKTYQRYFEWIATKFWDYYDSAVEQKNFKVQVAGSPLTGSEKMLNIVFNKWYEFISVSTSIINNFGGIEKEIEHMSTGELATVLLKLKLVTEGLNKQIILLDQPEDHLDNSFIASGLVDLLKTIKQERQIIVATHNANLVVGADSEQVIIAHGIDHEYTFGALEDKEIRDGIIDILEGGRDAFRKRSDKLQLARK